MSLIEQAPKTYNNRKQDHGDAAEQKGHRKDTFEPGYDTRGQAKHEAHLLTTALTDIDEPNYQSMSYAALEAEADKILQESALYSTTSSPQYIPSSETAAHPYNGGEDEDIESYLDEFPSEAEVEQLSKKRIREMLARRATLDSEYDDEDDHGDNYYGSAIIIKNRL
jgi:hypothetical protein